LPAGDLIVEELEGGAARQVHKGGLDSNAGNPDVLAEIRAIERRSPARRDAEERFPEGERIVEAGDAHADVMNRGRGCSRSGRARRDGHAHHPALSIVRS
jgi:hypothetical protein